MKATFAAGCFWGVEEAFRKIEGVKTVVGYSGGGKRNPTYKQVCSGKTGHAESVQVTFDPKTVSYGDLLETFWKIHDPTQKGRQGPDVGNQYRSVIFYHNERQKKAAEKSLARHQKELEKKIATEILPFGEFWKAEEYHQNYFGKHRATGCLLDILKKLG